MLKVREYVSVYRLIFLLAHFIRAYYVSSFLFALVLDVEDFPFLLIITHKGIARIFQMGVTLCHTKGTHQIDMSTSTPCFT